MAVTFHKVKYKNFLSSGNTFTELQLDKHPTTLIVGENGAGKSTFVDAICFALFNKPFRSINKSQLINSINESNAVVEITFSVGTHFYQVTRGLKPNIFEIKCDGVVVEHSASVRDHQEYLEKYILKLNFKSFTQIVVLGSSSFVPFMQLKANERRIVIEDLLDIQIFSTMNSLLKQYVSDNKQVIADNKQQISLITNNIELKEYYIEQLNQKTSSIVQGYERDIENSKSERLTVLKDISNLQEQVQELLTTVTDFDSIKNKYDKLQQYDQSIRRNMSKQQKSIQFYENNNDCPTCKQYIDESFKTAEINKKQMQIEDMDTGLQKISSQLIDLESRLHHIQSIQSKISDLQSEITYKHNSLESIESYIDKLTKQKQNIQENNGDIKAEKKALKTLRKDQLDKQKNYETMLSNQELYMTAQDVLKDTGIKTRIIKQYLPVMNKVINKYLGDLNFFASFHLDESFNEIIKSRHRDQFTYSSFSEGEKSRINIALLMCWRTIARMKNSANTNLLIMDEIFDSSLDAEGVDNLLKILNNHASVNTFIISHKGEQLYDKFSNILRVKKQGNFSNTVEIQ